ncbi:MAG: monovalent cation/H+ antiporter complex subunit F [Methanoregula sp.]|nr:monovalent cation/H+ antiporter complex subunit F [Methanoregula sp.]
MIDTWLFAAVCMVVLAFCAVLRILPGPTRLDQMIALNAAITIACSGLLCLAIALGNLFVLDIAMILAIAFFVGTIWFTGRDQGEPQ